jgi:hypothetical protein
MCALCDAAVTVWLGGYACVCARAPRYRVFHGGWHFFGGLSGYFLWRVQRVLPAGSGGSGGAGRRGRRREGEEQPRWRSERFGEDNEEEEQEEDVGGASAVIGAAAYGIEHNRGLSQRGV